jgi:tetratricopeptide (TPR) repeat protein
MKILIPIFIILTVLLTSFFASADEKKQDAKDPSFIIKEKQDSKVTPSPDGVLTGLTLEWFEKAQRRFDQKVFDDAIVYVSKVIKVVPDYIPAYRLRGLAYIEKGRRSRASKDDSDKSYNKYIFEFKKSIENFSRIIELDPKNKDAYFYRGMSYRFLDYYPTLAVDDLNKYIEEFGVKTPEAYTERGIVLYQLGFIPEAIVDVKEAISIDPNYRDAYVNLMKAVDVNEEYKAAIEYFTTLTQSNPDSAFPWYYRGLSYYKSGDHASAASDFRKALQIYPDYEDAKEMLSKI